MNDLIAKLYDQAIVIEDGGDYVAGELDLVKFAKLIVQECSEFTDPVTRKLMLKHFGVES